MHVNLTPAFIARAKAAPGAERTLFWDLAMPSFALMVTRSGHKSFVVQYRHHGRSRRMKIRHAQNVTEARKQARALLGEVAKERDPLAERRKAAAAAGDSFKSIAESYFASSKVKALRGTERVRADLERLVFPRLGARPIVEIGRSDITRVLDKIETENGPGMADAVLGHISKVCSWHATRRDHFRSPIVRGMRRTSAAERARKRVLDDAEIRALWRATAPPASPHDYLVRLLLLTGVRRNELALAKWDEISGAEWIIPADRMKGKVEHLVTLPKMALDLLDQIPRLNSNPHILPNQIGGPFVSFSDAKDRLNEASGVTGWRLHDLRRTARSLMSRAGVPPDHAEACLAHKKPGVKGIYDRHEYKIERAAALEKLATLIERIVNDR